MSDDAEHNAEQQVEQITKAPSNVMKKEKDPKRVAAGKKLAEKNEQMKEDYARLKASEEERRITEAQRATESLHAVEPGGGTTNRETNDSGWLSFTNVISMVGIGLAVLNIYMRYQDKDTTNREEWREPVTVTMNHEEPKRKFGM